MWIRDSRGRRRWRILWLPLRAGTDVAFLGGLIRYVLENEKDFREYVLALHQCSGNFARGFSGHGRAGGDCFPGWDEAKSEYTNRDVGCIEGAPHERRGRAQARDASGGHAQDRGGEKSQDQYLRAGSDAAESALRVPGVEEAFCAVHAGDGGGSVRDSAEVFSEDGGDILFRIGTGEDRRRSAMRWDGRSIRTECRSSARRQFCNCCWAISGGPAAGFWRCAGTRRFRARRIFPRYTTFCRATYRCRALRRMSKDAEQYIEKHKSENGMVEQLR